ncbi:MAG TPA: ThiF family adenylyltransferase [Lactovum miscens]|uniref:ThiF family adenylyltransferase n=1 Tax=Lactovum miscens TaxID=190387 RepID=UPI002ED9B32C
MYTDKEIYENIFRMQRMYLSLEEQQKIINSRIAFLGVGGIGSSAFEAILRNGFSHLNLTEKDKYELNNYRQLYMTTSTVGKSKGVVALQRALEINPYATINFYEGGLNSNNAHQIFKGVDLIIQEADTVVSSVIANYWGDKLRIPVIHGSREFWLNSHELTVDIKDYRRDDIHYKIDCKELEKSFGIPTKLSEQLILTIEGQENSEKIEKEVQDINREFRRKSILQKLDSADSGTLKKFTDNKDLDYIRKVKDKYPLLFDKQRVAPEQVMIMGAMVAMVAKKVILNKNFKKPIFDTFIENS